MRTSLSPVETALLDDAHNRALSILEAEEARGRSELARARATVAELLEQARTMGEAVAERKAALELALARGEAHGLVLGARRRLYETLRRSALDELESRAGSEDAIALGERLDALARACLGEGAAARQGESHALGASVTAGNRVATVSLEELVDYHLARLAERVEELWA